MDKEELAAKLLADCEIAVSEAKPGEAHLDVLAKLIESVGLTWTDVSALSSAANLGWDNKAGTLRATARKLEALYHAVGYVIPSDFDTLLP